MTSSNHLKSRLRSGLAFPIMLAAVGLLLASLVLGFGTNLVNALGKDNSGICDYSELMRDAILANNGDKVFECDSDEYTDATATERDLWGGVKADNDEPNDLDLTDANVGVFKPGRGELDGFIRGSRVDLRGTGLTVADIDISDARKNFTDSATTDDDDTVLFGNTVLGMDDGSVADLTNAATGLGLTFLLDGGSTSASGLASQAYSGVEGEVLWVTFEYGAPHKDFKHPSDIDISVWARVNITVEHDDIDPAAGTTDTTTVVSAVISTLDAKGTLYAVPILFPDDIEIEKEKRYDIDVAFAAAGTFEHVTTADGVQATTPFITGESGPLAITAVNFNDSFGRTGDEADLTITDEDTPAVPLTDRQDAVSDYISDYFGISPRRVGVDHLAGDMRATGAGRDTVGSYNEGPLTLLPVGAAPASTLTGAPPPEDAITSISVADLAGLKGLTKLDLSNNEIAELPSGLFAEVGTGSDADLSTEINLMGDKMGPNGDGFFLDNLGPAGDELVGGQYLVVKAPRKDNRIGFLQGAYEATEGGALVFDVNILLTGDNATPNAAVQFIKTAGDSGNLPGNDKDPDVKAVYVDLRELAAGNYRIAVALPVNEDEDGDNTLTAVFGNMSDDEGTVANLNAVGATATMTRILDVVPVTIRDASYEAPTEVPATPESSFESVIVTQNEYITDPTGDNEDLKHNVSNLLVTLAGGTTVNANFLDVYNATGADERWGLPTSEVVEIPGIGLTQFFQRGALHLESNAEVKRLLAWDYVGGHLGENDQGVESVPEAGPEGGEQIGAFNHYVANVDAEGNATGFLDFFNRLGGVEAFGIPKTEARADTGDAGTLLEPGKTPEFTRQYFQAAVFELGPDGPRLTLLGDTLRGILVPGYADIEAFGAADQLSLSDEISPPVIAS